MYKTDRLFSQLPQVCQFQTILFELFWMDNFHSRYIHYVRKKKKKKKTAQFQITERPGVSVLFSSFFFPYKLSSNWIRTVNNVELLMRNLLVSLFKNIHKIPNIDIYYTRTVVLFGPQLTDRYYQKLLSILKHPPCLAAVSSLSAVGIAKWIVKNC